MTDSEAGSSVRPVNRRDTVRRMRNFAVFSIALLLCLEPMTVAAQTAAEHRQAYLALIYHVRSVDVNKFVQSDRRYSAALASHSVSGALFRCVRG